ncbi:tetratricopeptide repeat protein [Flavobacterium algicola]|uniref:tetratricopeptide repeat protein n=1 Tax=Flavobacterium algicola TaxID=556529 RepID=UPI001EFD4CC9|nr:hypothetical protein [Flavobacterium algicola]MCG9792364.1 hypothetical protein [Flavobacterium algicola]
MKTPTVLLLFSLHFFAIHSYSQEKRIDFYRVQEIINDRFGGSKTIYSVSDLSLVSKVDLGPNNQRIITPVYVKERIKPDRLYASRTKRTVPPKLSEYDQEKASRIKKQINTNSNERNLTGNQGTNSTTEKDRYGRTILNDGLHTDDNNYNSRGNNNAPQVINSTLRVSMPAQKLIVPMYKEEVSEREISQSLLISTTNTLAVSENNINVESVDDAMPIIHYTFLNQKNEIIEDTKMDEDLLEKEVANFKKYAVYEQASSDPNRVRPQYAYVKVYETYERVAEKGYKSIVLYTKLSDYFYFENEMKKAVKWYDKLFDANKKLDTVYYYRYAAALIKTGKTKKGNEMMDKYNKMVN